MCENEYLIKTENLSFTYIDDDEVSVKDVMPAVKNVSISVKRGDYIAILGHNGSGKSTLAKLFNLILIPSSGKIYIDGKDVSSSDLDDDEIFEVRKKIGMVFQNPDNQLVATIVEEDVAFGPENLGLQREEIRKRVDDAIALVGMQEYVRHAPHKLSGGQKQRVAIAGVVAMRPECIIFDEATAMLDPVGRHDVLGIMDKLGNLGSSEGTDGALDLVDQFAVLGATMDTMKQTSCINKLPPLLIEGLVKNEMLSQFMKPSIAFQINNIVENSDKSYVDCMNQIATLIKWAISQFGGAIQ